MKRAIVFLAGFTVLITSGTEAARRPRERNYDATSAWDKRRGYHPTPPNNRPTGPIAGVFGTPGKSLAPKGAGNTLKSRVPYDEQKGTNGIYPDSFGNGRIGFGSKIGSFGSGQPALGFPQSGPINGGNRFNKPAEVEKISAIPAGLQEALDDITTSWSKRDPKFIRSRFPAQKAVAIYQDGNFSYESPGPELAKQVSVGVQQLLTQRFELDEPVKDTPTRYFVSGKHTFLDEGGQKRQFHVSYVLEQAGERWHIAEYGVSQKPIERHGARPAKEEAFAPGSN